MEIKDVAPPLTPGLDFSKLFKPLRRDGKRLLSLWEIPSSHAMAAKYVGLYEDGSVIRHDENGTPFHAPAPYALERIMPEPQLVPWTLREVPVTHWFRRKLDGHTHGLPHKIIGPDSHRTGFVINGNIWTPDEMLEHHQHADHPYSDTWEPCGKLTT